MMQRMEIIYIFGVMAIGGIETTSNDTMMVSLSISCSIIINSEMEFSVLLEFPVLSRSCVMYSL